MKMTKNDLKKIINETYKEMLNEGFMDYSVMGSDQAADTFIEMTERMKKTLLSGLKVTANEWNTPGSINVGMIFDEYIIPSKFNKDGDFKEVADATTAALKKELEKAIKWNTKEPSKSGAKYIEKIKYLINVLKKVK